MSNCTLGQYLSDDSCISCTTDGCSECPVGLELLFVNPTNTQWYDDYHVCYEPDYTCYDPTSDS